jgi:O-acetyl-ADP-ribose deacetylase
VTVFSLSSSLSLAVFPSSVPSHTASAAPTASPKQRASLRSTGSPSFFSSSRTTKDRVEIDVGGKHLILCIGDLTTFDGDAIVNAANEAMLGGGGVDGEIHKAAGPALLTECRKVQEVSPGVRCPAGEARMTTAPVPGGFGRLKTDCVIHTVGPRSTDTNRDAMLTAAYTNSIRLAKQKGLRSIAFPSISTGVYGVPVGRAAAIAMDVCKKSLQSDDMSLETIQFFFSNQAALDHYRSATQDALESLLQSIAAERDRAEKERTNPKRAQERARLDTPTEKPNVADLPKDMEYLKSSDPRYTKALTRLTGLPVHNGIKVVNVDERERKYTGFANVLKQDGAPSDEVQVFQGTPD